MNTDRGGGGNTDILLTIYMSKNTDGVPRDLGDLEEWLFIFRELGSTCNYFQGIGEQAHSFGDLGSRRASF